MSFRMSLKVKLPPPQTHDLADTHLIDIDIDTDLFPPCPQQATELQQKIPRAKTLRTKTLQQKTPPVKNSPSETACRSKTPQQDFRSKTPRSKTLRSKTLQQDFRSKTSTHLAT